MGEILSSKFASHGQLKYFPGALLIVSHDRYILDEVVDKIWELKDGKITLIRVILNREDGITVSTKVAIGYFAQDGYKYNHDQEVLRFMQEVCDYNVSEIRSVLASIVFISHNKRLIYNVANVVY